MCLTALHFLPLSPALLLDFFCLLLNATSDRNCAFVTAHNAIRNRCNLFKAIEEHSDALFLHWKQIMQLSPDCKYYSWVYSEVELNHYWIL